MANFDLMVVKPWAVWLSAKVRLDTPLDHFFPMALCDFQTLTLLTRSTTTKLTSTATAADSADAMARLVLLTPEYTRPSSFSPLSISAAAPPLFRQ